MKKYLFQTIAVLLFTIFNSPVFSQSSLQITSGANFYITSGTHVFIDNLKLKPSADFIIAGENALTRDEVTNPNPLTAHIKRVYHWANALASYEGDITIYYQEDELNGITEKRLNLNVYDGNQWTAFKGGNVVKDDINNFVATTGVSINDIQQLTLAYGSWPLPVILSRFNVQKNNCQADISWTTASQQNIKNFEVQFSSDGIRFNTIGVVNPIANSSQSQNYQYQTRLNTRNNFFRLLIADTDGETRYSDAVAVVSNCANSIIAYPNPAEKVITISGLEGVNQLVLVDAAGKTVISQNTANAIEKINVANLASGTYIIQVLQNNQLLQSIKVVKK